MSVADLQAGSVGNALLDALPRRSYDELSSILERVSLGFKEPLYEPNKPIPYVFFHLRGVGSLLTVLEDGSAIEVATVGNEGMVGVPVFLGAGSIPGQAFQQIPGEALRMKSETFRQVVDGGGPLHAMINHYIQALFSQIAQSAACNRMHAIEKRMSRWLLMTHDRVGADRFPLTHEFLSQMLGVRRASVSVAAANLQKAGLITYHRGVIEVLDRARLEAASCECYVIIKMEFDRLVVRGPGP